MKVLIADDEPIVRSTVSRLLKLEAYEVVVASDGRAAPDSAVCPMKKARVSGPFNLQSGLLTSWARWRQQ